MTQKHKRPAAPASKKLATKAGKPAAAAHKDKAKAAHAAKAAVKHADVKKPSPKSSSNCATARRDFAPVRNATMTWLRTL